MTYQVPVFLGQVAGAEPAPLPPDAAPLPQTSEAVREALRLVGQHVVHHRAQLESLAAQEHRLVDAHRHALADLAEQRALVQQDFDRALQRRGVLYKLRKSFDSKEK